MKTAVKERPIILRSEEVRAILDGRKTQHRVPVKPQPDITIRQIEPGCAEVLWQGHKGLTNAGGGTRNRGLDILTHLAEARCPLGRVGERLWVKETWARYRPFAGEPTDTIIYAADLDGCGQCPALLDGDTVLVSPRDGWRPSTTMPRQASRLTLEITGVRAERLQSIAGDDARAEGAERGGGYEYDTLDGLELRGRSHRGGFREAWDARHAARGLGWNSNPWVWVLAFRPVETAAVQALGDGAENVNLTGTNEG